MATLGWAPRGTNPWFSRALHGPLRARVFAFPQSGTAGAASYGKWLDIWPESIELCALELPGRPSRLGEPAFSDFDALAGAVAEQLAPLCDVPFVVFGASLGAAMSYATVRRLGELGVRPAALMIAACTVPTFGIPRGQPSFRLPDAEFVAAIEQSYGGTMLSRLPPAVLSAVLPGLRADFQMMEISTLPPQPLPVDCPIIAYAGIDDPMLPPTAIEAWGAWTSRGFRFEALPRGHFFLTEERERLIRDIVAQLPV